MDGFAKRRDADHRLDLINARAVAIWSRTDPRKIPSVKQIMQDRVNKPIAGDTQANARAWIAVLRQMNKGTENE